MHRQAGKWYLTRQTFPELLQRNVQRYPHRPAQIWKRKDGALQKLSFGELGEIVRELSAALLSRGVQKEEAIAIVAPSIPQWVWADYAILCTGAITVAISPDLFAEEMRRQVEDSGAKRLFVADAATLLSLLSDPPQNLSEIIWLGEEKEIPFGDFRGTHLDAFRAEGRAFMQKEPLAYGARWRSVQPDEPMTLVYTKSAQGRTRGILHTHASINHACIRDLGRLPLLTEKDLYLCVLPLSSLLERQAGHASAMLAAIPVAYFSGNIFSAGALEENLLFFHPTYLLAVPLIYEKLLANLEQRSIGKDFFSRKARVLGLKILEKIQNDDGSIALEGELGPFVGMNKAQAAEYRLADFLVYRKIRRRLGGSIRFMICAGSILHREACLLFLVMGIPVLQGYGPAETCHMVSLMPSDCILPESAGAFPKMISYRLARSGELLVQGNFLFKGYWKDSSTGSGEFSGWRSFFPCGYRVEISESGFVRILEKKEGQIVLATGHTVSPSRIERLFALHPYFERALVVGDRRPYPLLLILPNFTNLVPILKKEGAVFDEEDLTTMDGGVLRVPEEFFEMPELASILRKEIRIMNQQLEPFEKIGGMLLVRRPFSFKSGETDEHFTIQRKVVEEKLKDFIDDVYRKAEPF